MDSLDSQLDQGYVRMSPVMHQSIESLGGGGGAGTWPGNTVLLLNTA